MLTLARECDIRTCEYRVVSVREDDVLLVRRFDRVKVEGGYLRHRFVSGLTILGAGETFGGRSRWSYLLLADELRRRSHRAAEDLRERFTRMIVNALISNTDDHPRNYGLIAPDRDFELAPAYDRTPNPRTSVERRDLALIVGRYNRFANRENLLSECVRFRLSREEAGTLIDRVKEIVRTRWHPAMRAHGVIERDCEVLAGSFCYEGFEFPASAAPS